MPFDPLRTDLWEARWNSRLSEEERKSLEVWMRKIPDRMTKPKGDSHLMPPEDSEEAKNFDLNRQEFAEYKNAVNKFRELLKK
jgi:hypothetical protein